MVICLLLLSLVSQVLYGIKLILLAVLGWFVCLSTVGNFASAGNICFVNWVGCKNVFLTEGLSSISLFPKARLGTPRGYE